MGRKINFSKGIGLRGLRMLAGLPGHAPSAFSLCIGATLRGQDHPAAPLGSAGKENVAWRKKFIDANESCGRSVPKITRTRKTPIS